MNLLKNISKDSLVPTLSDNNIYETYRSIAEIVTLLLNKLGLSL